MTYVDADEMRDYLRSKVTADETEILAAQMAADSGIDDYCQRSLLAAAGTSVKNYTTAEGSERLWVHDIGSTSDITVVDDGVTLAVDEYTLVSQALVTGDMTSREWPYIAIDRVDSTWSDDVDVTAEWGWAATPPEVPIASRLLTRDLLMARDMSFGIVQVGEFSRRIAENGVVELLLTPLRRPEAIPVA